MTGYQEILSDPSYRGQLVCMTASHIGIVGTTPLDEEASLPQAQAMIVRSLSRTSSNWRSKKTLEDYFVEHGITGISDIDTRSLTQLLRDKGNVNGCVIHGKDHKKALRLVRECRPMDGYDLASDAGTKRSFRWDKGNWIAASDEYPAAIDGGPSVALVDCGAKRSIMRELTNAGLSVSVVPYDTDAKKIAGKFSGLVVSNGPGDPRPLDKASKTVGKLLGEGFPILGICLGHQILAKAAGAQIKKMKFGHHGANHPILEKDSGRVFISSQNHGFAVVEDGFPKDMKVSHISLFDGSVQGIIHKKKPAMGFQGHPEASPGPRELSELFAKFAKMVKRHAKKN